MWRTIVSSLQTYWKDESTRPWRIQTPKTKTRSYRNKRSRRKVPGVTSPFFYLQLGGILLLVLLLEDILPRINDFLGITQPISCTSPYIIDGDTFDCNGTRIRLAGIDTPEMPGHCNEGRICTDGDPFAARDALSALATGTIHCYKTDKDVYGRTVARCRNETQDLSCAMIDNGHAVRRYGYILCL